MRLHRLAALLAASSLLSLAVGAQEEPAFPPDSPVAHAVDPAKLTELGEFVRGLCQEEEVVGAELLVIKDGRTLLHEAYGWRDRDEERPMETDTVFCVRSMTKPVIGTAIQMLVDEGKVELGAPVATYLPSFDNDRSRAITIEQLLRHTSGLPLTVLTEDSLKELESITALAALGGERGPEFEPGTRFQYSDPGADALAAVVEAASGLPLEAFVRARILEPLSMSNSTCRMTEDDPLRERACSSYMGRRGAWTRFWSRGDPPIFPFLLGSQALYSTPVDYARFLQLWLKRGLVGGDRLLSARAVRRAFEPGPHPASFPTGFAGLDCEYGELWQLWIDPEQKRRGGLVAFGHGGSDGTQAWAFPEERLMVLLFTQSRGHGVGMLIEERVDQLLRGAVFDPSSAAPELAPFLGLYQDVEAEQYLAVLQEDGKLAIEMPGRYVLETRYAGEERWKLAQDPRVLFSFRRGDDGAVSGILITEPAGEAELQRLVPAEDLPTADELIERLTGAHHLERLSETGAVQLSGVLSIPVRQTEARIVQTFAAPDHYRTDIFTTEGPQRAAWDGSRATIENSQEGVVELEGVRREQTRLESFLTLARDWHLAFEKLEVLMRVQGPRDPEPRLVVRATPKEAHPVTLIVGEESGRLLEQYRIAEAPMIGRIGVTVEYLDFRDVDGMLLPFRLATTFPTPLIGTATIQFEAVEVGVAVADDEFVIRGKDE